MNACRSTTTSVPTSRVGFLLFHCLVDNWNDSSDSFVQPSRHILLSWPLFIVIALTLQKRKKEEKQGEKNAKQDETSRRLIEKRIGDDET